MIAAEETEVVISGIGGLLPKSNNVEDFQKLLFNNEEMVGKGRPNSNPNVTYGYISGTKSFDATFFGIHRLLAENMDILYRKSLESTFEAIVDAGISPSTIRGRKIAVIMSSTFTDNENNIYDDVERGAGVVTQARAMLSNRISYWMNAVGPSYSVYNNWIGGMSSLEDAYNLIKSGQCEGAIIGALNTVGQGGAHNVFSEMGVTSKDETTRPFDEDANGYVRSDSMIVFFLQRADLARRRYATIVNVDTIFTGHNNDTYTKINIDSARNFLTNFYNKTKVDPSTVQYVETYGSALKFLDTLELNVLDEVFNNSSRTEPLLIGSVKSNMGHAEAASVLVSVVKTILAMEKRIIPANLNYKHKNVNIPALNNGKIKVVAENTPWPGTLAAVNGYGLVSSCGHILLKSNTQPIKTDTTPEKLPHLYIFSTRTEEGIQEIIEQIKSYETLNDDYMSMVNNVFMNNIPGHLYRGCIVRDNENKIAETFSSYSGDQRPVWFVYSGMGSQWITMGKDLMRLPIFATAVHKCHKALEPHGVNVLKIICSDDDPDVFNNILHSFVGIAAIQIGLTDVLHALGIQPDNIIGHSVGELGCAYADGCLTAEQMILSAYYRGRASQEVELIPGLMAAVGMGADKIKYLIPPTVDIACRNGPESCTLSGPAEDMEELVSRLQGSHIFARAVNVAGIAYHSRYIKPAAPLLFEYLKTIVTKPKLRSAKWLCSSIPEDGGGWNTELAQHASAEYFTNNLLSCVHFEPLLKYIPDNAIVIEVAPHGLLQAILKRSIAITCDNIALTRRGENKGTDFLFKNIGKIYLAGLQLNIPVLYEDNTNQSKAVVPCSRGTPSLAPLVKWNHLDEYIKGFYNSTTEEERTEETYLLTTNSENFRHLNGHRIYDIDEDATEDGTIIVPLTAYLPLIVSNNNNESKVDNVIFEDVQLYRHRVIPDEINSYNPPITIMTLAGTNSFEINDRYGTVASGRCIISNENVIVPENKIIKNNVGHKIDELSSDELYREFTNRGHNFQHVFRAIQKLEIYEKGMIANIEWKSEWHTFVANMLQMFIFQHGRFSCRPIDAVFIRSLSCMLGNKNIPKQGAIIEVIYNYTTDVMSSSIITIRGSHCQPCRIDSDAFVAHKCLPVAQQKNFADFNNEHNISVININEAAINVTDLNSNLPWIKELNEKLNNCSSGCIYLISRELPINGIDSFLNNLQGLPNGERLRLILILDANAPEFKSINDRFYQPAFKQQESNVSVYCAGIWEYRYTISTKLGRKNTDQHNIRSILSEKNIKRYLPDVNVRFIGINTMSMDPTLSNISVENQLSIIDYAGLENKTSQPVMGLATINNKKTLSSDTILRWPLPKQWSLADGATIPFAYCIAYYALYECVTIDHTQSILIHNGCSSIGQAMIRIAHSIGCNIYTTVANEKQRVSLLKTMKMLKCSSVFEFTSNFERQIMEATCGEGIHVLVNCLPGDSLQAGLRCVSTLGRVILLFDENCLEKQYNESIGLSVFLRCFGMHPIRSTTILDLPEETKKNLYTHILNGIRENHVLPLNKNLFREKGTHQLSNIAKYLSDPLVTRAAVVPIEELVKNRQFKNVQNSNQVHKVDSTFIVYGGENVDNIISLTQWLVTSYGIKNILIVSSCSTNTNDKKYVERNLTALKSEQKDVTIKLLDVAANKPDLILQQIVQQKITNIGGVLILSNENIQSAYLLIKKIQTKFPTIHTVLLNSVSNANRVNLERYHEKNIKNVSFLRWDKKLHLPFVLENLTIAMEDVVDIFVRNNKILETRNSIKTNFSFQDFCNLLSTSISSILKYIPVKTGVTVEPMITKNTKHTTDLSPVFIVPGLLGSKCTYLQSTIRNLLDPAYVLDAAYGTSSLEQLTVRAGEQIRKIFPSGPYNLIGVSTGGPLAIELAKHLETDHGATVQLYLLDAVPDTIKYLLSPSGDESNFETTLLKQLLNIDDAKLLARLSTLPNWNSKIDAVLQSCAKSKHMKLVLETLKLRRDAAVTYLSNKHNFNGVTHVIIPNQRSGESSKIIDEHKQLNVKVIEGNHFTMLQERALVEYINANIIYPSFYN